MSERFRSLSTAFFRGTDVCMYVSRFLDTFISYSTHFRVYSDRGASSLVYDVTEPKTLDSLAQWKNDFIDQVGIEEEDEFAFIVVGNKVDLEATRQVQRSKGEQVARELGAVAHFETSAKTAHNVEKTFHMAATTALKRTSQRKAYVVYVSFHCLL